MESENFIGTEKGKSLFTESILEEIGEGSIVVDENRELIRKLKASEKRFKAILDTATDAIISIDSNHNIVLFNNAAQRIFGYTRDEVLGKDLNLLIPQQYGNHSVFVRKFLESGDSKILGKSINLTGLKSNGEEIPIELGLSHMKIDGENTFTAMVRDISEQKQLEKKLLRAERFAAVGQIVAHVAHEIKSPLMIIGGFSHQIKDSLSDEKALMKLEMIIDEVSRLEKLVASLGDFTKVYRLVKRPADINSVILDVLKIVEVAYSDEFKFESRLFPELNEIKCDPDKIRQVLLNIIANAIDAMKNGGTISVSTENVEDGIEIRIRDEGIGIRDEDILHIFEPFYTTRDKGSGLGLAICYKIVEAHSGDIWVDSIPGQGTTFVVRLPSG